MTQQKIIDRERKLIQFLSMNMKIQIKNITFKIYSYDNHTIGRLHSYPLVPGGRKEVQGMQGEEEQEVTFRNFCSDEQNEKEGAGSSSHHLI